MRRNNSRNGNSRLALSRVMDERAKLHDENVTLEQRLGEKTRTITHLESNMADLKDTTAKEIASVRAEAQESDELKDQLLVVGTKTVQAMRVKLEAAQRDKERLATTLEASKKSLEQLRDAYFNGAPLDTRAAVEIYSKESLGLVRNLQADLARVQATNRSLLEKQAGMEDLQKRNTELRAKSERDNTSLQELRRAREEDKRTVRLVEAGKRAADSRAKEARFIAEDQQVVIDGLNELVKEHERQFR